MIKSGKEQYIVLNLNHKKHKTNFVACVKTNGQIPKTS